MNEQKKCGVEFLVNPSSGSCFTFLCSRARAFVPQVPSVCPAMFESSDVADSVFVESRK